MKTILKSLSLILLSSLIMLGCKKDEIKTIYNGGDMPELSASSPAVNMTAIDSTKSVVTLSWTDPVYSFSTGKSTLTVTHTIEIDSTGRNFARPEVVSSTNVLQESSTRIFVRSFTGEELNNILMKLGMQAGKSYSIDVRVSTSLYVGSTRLTSNTLVMGVTPYSAEPQPLYPVPDSLYIVGDATPGGWGNPVPSPAQKFTKIDKNTFGIILPLGGAGKFYVLLPKNGDWGSKYAVANNSTAAARTEESFSVNSGQDIPAPTTPGLYKIIVNFITGKYTVSPVDPTTIPANLFIVGDATPGGWANPVPVPTQQLTKNSAYTFTINLSLGAGKYYVFLPENGSWGKKFAIADKTNAAFKVGGLLKVDSGDDIPSPDAGGMHRIDVNFLTMSYAVTKL